MLFLVVNDASHRQSAYLVGICLDKFMCCRTETELPDQTCYLTQSVYTYTGPANPSTRREGSGREGREGKRDM